MNLPPECEMLLEMLARSLGLEPTSDEWFTFFDTAAAERSVLPYDLAADDKLVDALPVFFGAIRMASNDGQLDRLVDLIRESLRATA